MEIVAFGLPFYFISGLAYDPRAFFVYLAILICKRGYISLFYVKAHCSNQPVVKRLIIFSL